MSVDTQSEETELDVRALTIQTQNDLFRKTLLGGRVLVTPGVQAFDQTIQTQILKAIQEFDDFTPGNDPHQEHDFGEVNVSGYRVWFKIDLYDTSLERGSADPTDPSLTTRVMTIFLPEEY